MVTARGAIVTGIMLSITCAARATPSDEAFAPIADAMNRKTRVQLLQAPLERALELLQKESGVPFLIDRASLDKALKAPVELSVESIGIREALEMVLSQVREVGGAAGGDVDYDVRHGRVLVTTRAKAIRPYLTTRVFDIRALVRPHVNFTESPTVGLADVTPNHGGYSSQQTLFDEGDADGPLSRGETVGLLIELIRHSVRPGEHEGNWDIDGVSIREHNGLLVVVNTAEAIDGVSDLLDKYQQAYGKLISVNARFVLIKTASLESFIADTTKGKLVLDAEQVAALLKLAGEGDAARIIGTARTVCFNDQRVYVTAGNERAFLQDLDPAVGTDAAAFDPEMATLVNSTVLDVEPTASFDNKTVSMVIRGSIALGERMAARQNVAAMTVAGRKLRGPDPDAANDADRREGPGEVDVVPGGIASGTATIDVPDQDSARFRTSAKIPAGGGVMLSAFSDQFKHFKPDGHEIVLLIGANVSP